MTELAPAPSFDRICACGESREENSKGFLICTNCDTLQPVETTVVEHIEVSGQTFPVLGKRVRTPQDKRLDLAMKNRYRKWYPDVKLGPQNDVP